MTICEYSPDVSRFYRSVQHHIFRGWSAAKVTADVVERFCFFWAATRLRRRDPQRRRVQLLQLGERGCDRSAYKREFATLGPRHIYLSIFICSITNHTAQQRARTVEQDKQGSCRRPTKQENEIKEVTQKLVLAITQWKFTAQSCMQIRSFMQTNNQVERKCKIHKYTRKGQN